MRQTVIRHRLASRRLANPLVAGGEQCWSGELVISGYSQSLQDVFEFKIELLSSSVSLP